MIQNLQNIFTFIGGIGMFLYGMKTMSEGMQKVAGAKFSNILKTLTKNKITGIIVGAIVTIVVNSSSATTVMLVGFVNAGIMNLNQAMGVIMGSNIGTTLTAWLIAIAQFGDTVKIFEPSFFGPLLLGVSAIVLLFSKKERTKTKANIFVGIGILFVGLNFMSSGVAPYAQSKLFSDSFIILGKYPPLAILAGLVVTAILQSSTASVSILQTLALKGSVSKSAACFITIGQNIGTCITAIISSTGTNKNAKRTALLHLLFNVFGALIFSLIVFILYPFIKDFINTRINLIEISIFHTGFNILNTVILFPFSDKIVKMSQKIIKDDEKENTERTLSEKTKDILDDRILEQPTLAITTVKNEVLYFGEYALKNVKRAINLMIDKRDEELIQEVVKHEEEIDLTNAILVEYLTKVNNLSLTNNQHIIVEHLLSMCSDIERMGDHSENISENAMSLYNEDINFSESALEELKYISNITIECVESAINCMKMYNENDIKNVRRLETEIDDLEDRYRQEHIKRLSNGVCKTVAGIAFLDTIGNFERISDHANNLADYAEEEIKNNIK